MNYFFRRLPLSVKLLLISLVPLLFLIYLFVELYIEKTQKVTLLQSYLARIDQSADMAKLIDALRQENRYSYNYALQKSQQPQMLAQRPVTDSLINRIHQYQDPALKEFTQYTFLADLASIRNNLDSSRMDANGVMHYFTNTIFRLNTLNQVSAGANVYLQNIYPDLVAQRLLSEMTTYLGILGANVHNVLFTRAYMVETLVGSLGVYQVYHTYEKELQTKAPAQTYAAYQNLLQNTSLKPTVQYLDRLFKTFQFDSTYTPRQWEQTYTPALNELRALQQSVLKNVDAQTTSLYQSEKRQKNQSIIILFIAIAVAIIIVAYTVAVINQMLKELKKAAQKIAKGKSGIRVKKESNDAIGSLAESIIQIDKSNKELSKVAEAIGKGDFSTPIQPRSADDILSHALIYMRDNLQKNTAELIEKEKQFRELADFMPQIVWTALPDGNVDYWNKQWYAFSGLQEPSNNESWLQVMHPDDIEKTLQIWNHATQTGTDYQIEYRLKDSRTGKYKWFLAKALPSKDKEGAINKWFGTCTEIHERKTMSEKLEMLVIERTEELKRSNEDLQQFAHVASHDLKEPLRKVRTFSSRLLDEFGTALPERGVSYLEKMQDATERMTNMVDGILHYSTINAVQEAPVLVNLNEVVDGIISDLEVTIQQKRATITHSNLPHIAGTPVLLHQLFFNLINNSLKFSKPDVPPVITITCTLQNEALNKNKQLPGLRWPCYQITIQDNGIGFDTEYSGKMFEIFSRLNPRNKFEGTGLGLALCKKIVHRHHGEICAEGKENEGASFHIYFPAPEGLQ